MLVQLGYGCEDKEEEEEEDDDAGYERPTASSPSGTLMPFQKLKRPCHKRRCLLINYGECGGLRNQLYFRKNIKIKSIFPH